MVFVQVLEPFCLLSEQEILEAEEPEPAYSTAVLILSQTQINPSSFSSDAHSPNCTNEFSKASLTETDHNTDHLNADQLSLTQPSMRFCTDPPPEVVLLEKNDMCLPLQPQTESDHLPGFSAVPVSETVSVESINDPCNEIAMSSRPLQQD